MSPPCGRSAAARMHNHIDMCIRASTPAKLGTKLLESMFVTRGLFHSLHVWSDWPKSTSPIIVLPLAEKANSKPAECVQVLSSERKAIGNTWQNPVWRAWRKKMNITVITVSGDRRLASPRSWEMHRVPRMVCLESFLKGLKLSYFSQLSKLEVKESISLTFQPQALKLWLV